MSEYKDIKNNTHRVTQRMAGEGEGKIYTEEEIVEALFKIFSGKWSRESEYKFLFISLPREGGGTPQGVSLPSRIVISRARQALLLKFLALRGIASSKQPFRLF